MRKDWTYKSLGEVCTIERGGSPRPIEAYITDSPDGLNWIKIGDATEGSKYITSTKEKIKPEGLKKTRFVHKGDFILSNSMSFGRPYILGIDGCIHDGWLVLRDDKDTFDKSYLYYVLSSPGMYREFKRLAVGGVVNNLNTKLVQSVVVAIPPRVEQQRIVAELDLLSGILNKQKQQLKELDSLAQSVFYDMFGDVVNNDRKWTKKRISDIGKVITGNTPSTSNKENYSSEDYCFVKPSDIGKEGVTHICETEYHVSSIAYQNARQLPKGSVLTTCIGIIGKVGILHQEAMCNQQINAVIPLTSTITSTYLSFCILNLRSILESMANAPVVPIINKGDFSSIQIPVPPITTQEAFSERIAAIEQQKARINRAIAETQKLFDYTMDKYFG